MRTRIDRGQVWSEGALRNLSILIENGTVARLIEPQSAETAAADRVLDAGGLWVLPGGIDLHVHISDGAETFGPGSRCAAAGGVTTVLDMAPFHGCVRPEQLKAKLAQAEAACVTDFGLIAGIVVALEDLEALDQLAEMGAAYFKVFMPSDPPVDARTLWASVQAAARTGLRLGLHAEETGCFAADVDWDDPLGFARSRPAVAETSATAQILEMARAAGAPVHICHVSAAHSAELIASARAQGVDVTSEVTAHFLLLDESEFARQGPRVKTTPPLRARADTEALWQALAAGVLDALACDHFIGSLAPAPADPSGIRQAAAGIGGLELSLPLLFSAGVRAGRIALERFVAAAAERPAEIAGLAPKKGRIAPGADADLILIDPAADWTVAPQGDFSRVATTPFAGWRLQGRIRRTMVRGRTVWDGERITAPAGSGAFAPARRAVS